ncbi:MAG TPA: hypothetical protein DDZ81_19535 [Acetobacteraceae bacterium]|jgi:hypothetical protein|nr:hypothetical protein [Acetobacteraceae bacterium]
MHFRLRYCLPALLLPLFGCGPERNQFAPLCPSAKLVPALADLTRYSGPGPTHDLTDMVLQARVVTVDGKCAAGDDKSVLPASVAVSFLLQRGPAMVGREADLPVFLAVVEGDTVRDKRVFQVHLIFPPNVDRMTITSPPIDLNLPVSPEKSGAAYGIIAGFQLTPEELAANRQGSGG